MEKMESKAELSTGYKLVPWSSWDQWNFVRESLFSSSPDSVSKALQRISAWRSRGCLPVPIDVTAAFIEIQQKDPYFREGDTCDSLKSEELLSMLYCMATMRLVNGFVEPAHKKTGRSISQLADAIGIPRMLVDIRHESSHRGLPSVHLVRLASLKALDWLRSNYWEAQRRAIPDVQREIRSRLREMIVVLKTKHSQNSNSVRFNRKRAKQVGMLMPSTKLSSQIVGKLHMSKSSGSKKHISSIAKRIGRLYSSYPSEVITVLLEFFHLQAPDFSNDIDMDQSDDSSVDEPGFLVGSLPYLKTIIIEQSNKKPGLILNILKTVLEILEASQSRQCGNDLYHFSTSKNQFELAETRRLCSLVHWLLMNFKVLKDSGRIGVFGEAPVLSTDTNTVPKVSLRNLLHKCLSLSVTGDKHLSDSILLLAEMVGKDSLREKLMKIALISSQDQEFLGDYTLSNVSKMLEQEEASIKHATEKLELLKSRISNRSGKSRRLTDGNTDTRDDTWTVSKSWIPCPIGMLPCPFSSSAVLPVLDKIDEAVEPSKAEYNVKVDADMSRDYVMDRYITEEESDGDGDENRSGSKRLRMSREIDDSDLPKKTDPMEGHLLIGGIWEKVSEDELHKIQLNINVFADRS